MLGVRLQDVILCLKFCLLFFASVLPAAVTEFLKARILELDISVSPGPLGSHLLRIFSSSKEESHS